MKRLYLLRHAKAVPGDADTDDFDRSLDPRGEAAAEAIGREMRRHGLVFDLILGSPAARTVQTLARASVGFGAALAAREDPRIYLASMSTLLSIVRETDDTHDSLLLVGHNPGFAMLAALLVPDSEAAEKFPTGALAEMAFAVDGWHRVAPAAGRLVRFIRPSDLDDDHSRTRD